MSTCSRRDLPSLGDPEDGGHRAHANLITLAERVKGHLWQADNQMYGKHVKRGENKGYNKDSQGNKIKGAPDERAPKCNGLMLLSQKAKVMRINPLDLIEVLGDYFAVTYGIYYNNGYPDIPMWLQENCREEVSFYTVVCGVGVYPDDQLERCARVCLETLYGAMFLKNQYRRWVEALSRTRYNNRAPVEIDPKT